jgi:hypothetical protein
LSGGVHHAHGNSFAIDFYVSGFGLYFFLPIFIEFISLCVNNKQREVKKHEKKMRAKFHAQTAEKKTKKQNKKIEKSKEVSAPVRFSLPWRDLTLTYRIAYN